MRKFIAFLRNPEAETPAREVRIDLPCVSYAAANSAVLLLDRRVYAKDTAPYKEAAIITFKDLRLETRRQCKLQTV